MHRDLVSASEAAVIIGCSEQELQSYSMEGKIQSADRGDADTGCDYYRRDLVQAFATRLKREKEAQQNPAT